MNPLFYKLKTLWFLIGGKVALHRTLLKRLFFGIIIILVLLIIAGFLYYNFYFKKDTLIKYVPKEAVFYSTLRINGEIKENVLLQNIYENINKKYNLPELDSAILNPYIGYNFALAMIPKENDFYNYNYLVLLNLRNQPNDSIFQGRGLYWHYFKNEYFNTNIIAISDSAQVIEKVVGARNQEWPSLASRIGVAIGLNKLKISKLGKIFIDAEELGEHFSELTDLKLKPLFAAIRDSKVDEIYLSVDFKDNRITISNSELSESSDFLLSKIPNNFIASLSANNISDQLIQIINTLSQIDPVYYDQIVKNKEYSQGMLNLDWQNDVFTLFTGKSQFIMYPEQKYLLAVPIDNWEYYDLKLVKLENIVSSIFSASTPKVKEKQLPDGTYITQLIKENSTLFEDIPVNNKNLRFIKGQNFEFCYLKLNNMLILANSRQLLEKFANEQDLVGINNESLFNFSVNLVFNMANFSSPWPIFNKFDNIYYSENYEDILLILE